MGCRTALRNASTVLFMAEASDSGDEDAQLDSATAADPSRVPLDETSLLPLLPAAVANMTRHQVACAQVHAPSVLAAWKVWCEARADGVVPGSAERLGIMGGLFGFGASGYACKNWRLITDQSDEGDEHLCYGTGPRQSVAFELGCQRKDEKNSVDRLSHAQFHKMWDRRELARITCVWNHGTFGDT